MKKISYYILILLLAISCKEKEKKTFVPETKPDTLIVDTSFAKPTTIDTLKTEEKEPLKNILIEEEKETTYKVKSISELWQTYKSAKRTVEKYITKNNLDSIIVYLNIAADAAYDLSREDIATWQLNNIGFYSINEFKNKTDYDVRIQNLATIKNLKKKGLYLEETKAVFAQYYYILSNAEPYLRKAQLLDNELEKSERTDIIDRNLKFIEWVSDFVSIKRKSQN